MIRVQHVFKGDFLAGVSGHAAHRGHDAGFDAAPGFVVRLVVADGGEQVVPLVEIRVALVLRNFRGPDLAALLRHLCLVGAGGQAAVAVLGDDGHALAAVGIARIHGGGTGDAPAIHVHLGAVLEGVLHRVRIEILIHIDPAIGGLPVVPSADCVRLHRPGALHHAEMVDVVDVEVAEAAAARPQEAVKAGDLPEQLAGRAGPFLRERAGERTRHAVAPQQVQVADLAVLNALLQFLQGPAVTGHQPHADLQVLGRRLLGQREHPPAGRTIGGERLLHEHIETLLDGILEMNPAKRQRRGEDGHVALLQGIHRVLVAVEADEFLVIRHIDHFAVPLLQFAVAVLELVLEHIDHRGQRDGAAFGGKSVACRARAAATAPDERELNGVVSRRVNVRQRHAGQRGSGCELAGVLDELPA